MIDPGSFVQSYCLRYKRIVVRPFANGVSPPCRIRILGELAAIRPDGAPYVMELHMLQHPVLSLNELKGSCCSGYRESDESTLMLCFNACMAGWNIADREIGNGGNSSKIEMGQSLMPQGNWDTRISGSGDVGGIRVESMSLSR